MLLISMEMAAGRSLWERCREDEECNIHGLKRTHTFTESGYLHKEQHSGAILESAAREAP